LREGIVALVPTVLLSGASTGIGRASAERLTRAGWRVLAGARSDADLESLAQLPGTEPIRLDVTSDDDVAAVAARVSGRLDALVNNAGIAVGGPIEGIPVEDLRNQLEVNVVGQVAVTQAVLPRLRAAQGGRIVFISSASGRVSAPMLGPYSASKFAIEAIADSLRLELRPWGIGVVLVEPGSIDTDMWRKVQDTVDESEASLSPENRALYAGHTAGLRRMAARIQKQTSPVEKVAEAVLKALTAERPKARYLVGADARIQLALQAGLPRRAFDAAVAKASGVPSKP